MPIPGEKAQARLGRYELLARLATGGMGEIFLARLEGAAGFEKLYVVKRILPHLADDTRFRQMLISEAQIAAKMAHGNICQVYELGETAGQLYIVMEYLEGVTMLPLLRRSSKAQTHLEFGLVAAIVQQACDALHYAHELKDRDGESLGLVHRDVTPSNLFLTESGVVKVLDFGIAKAKGATSAKTEDGAVKGKYAYMAPEQLRGGAIDRRVDLFALGIVMYEMLALRRLFQRKTDYLTFRAVMEQPIPDIRRYRPDIPDAVANVIVRALDREPATRFETARQLGNALLDAMSASGMRPWTQGDIGDMVKANFADEIAKRSHQVASAVTRTAPGAIGQRTTMPLITHDDSPGDHESDDDEEFPSVETDVDSAPKLFATRPPVEPSDAFVQSTPPPFAAETTGSAPGLQPIQGMPTMHTATQAPVVVVGQRSYIWPVVALCMIGVAGAALYLVWQQTQKQQPPPPSIIVQSGPALVPDAPQPTAAVVEDPPKSNGSAAAKRPPPPPARPKTINDTLNQSYKALNDCLLDYGAGVTDKMVAHVTYAPSGKTKMVQIDPPSQNTAPLGACFRHVLMAAQFPATTTEQTFQFDLKAKTN